MSEDVLASIAWDIRGDQTSIKRGDKIVLASTCFLDTAVGSIAVVPVIDLALRPDVLQARIIVAQVIPDSVGPAPIVYVSVDLGRHEDHFGEDGAVTFEVLTEPAFRVVLRCGEHELSGVAREPKILRPRLSLPNSTDSWVIEDFFQDVRRGVLDVLASYGEEIAEEIGGET